MKSLRFDGKVEKVGDVGGWHTILLPENIVKNLREQAGKKGNVPVLVTIGQTSYPTTIMSMGEQRWFFAVKAAVRKAENIATGDVVPVNIVPDESRLKK